MPDMLVKPLSERERLIVALLGAAYRQIDIAKLLGLSIKTVSTYALRACDKMNCNNTRDLARVAHQNGWAATQAKIFELYQAQQKRAKRK